MGFLDRADFNCSFIAVRATQYMRSLLVRRI
jgi:hypothetical protein